MNKKGYTLFETVLCIMIMGILYITILSGNNMLERIRFTQQVNTIERHIVAAQSLAHTKQMPYTVIFVNRKMYVKEGLKTIYAVPIQKNISLSVHTNSPDNVIFFRRDLSPVYCGTITLTSKKIGKQARITVRPVTGKTKVYYEDI